MNYIGSKHKLIPFIDETINKVVDEKLSDLVFCDLFAGTGIVGRYFKTRTKQVISNDFEYYSYVLNKNYIENHQTLSETEDLITHLNTIPQIDNGFIFQNYCSGSGSGRQYFSDDNGKRIDTIRREIKILKNDKKISKQEYYFLLASLLESADKVANTASVYGAFLKHLKKTAQKPLQLKPALFESTPNSHLVYNEDSNELIKNITGDILYLDPPYNARQYGANYHLLNTIAKYEPFEPKGVTGLPQYQKSKYCSKSTILEEFELLIKEAQFKYIFLSYNNEGLMTVDDIETIMKKYGQYSRETQNYQRFKADKDKNRNHKANHTMEYIHVLKK